MVIVNKYFERANENDILKLIYVSPLQETRKGKLRNIDKYSPIASISILLPVNREVRLTPQAINNEVRLLQSFAGNDETCALESIRFTSDYEFDNGCRAPPWRQVHGDICYLFVKPLDCEELSITANTAGVYRNKVCVC